ncbi:hypothetical protein [Pandoraea sp. ISTKB]|uniref:hypothetical protein n=1 Tax=Pandoraea sp. ISTKB TaxID=1586708 RepID=UPI001112EEAF|nr:hypothetical protein [Pandoraea sp. ISTKB]
MPATLPNALTTHTFAPNRLDRLDGLNNATSHYARHDIVRFDALSTQACTMLDESPEAQPALGLMLRLTEQGISIEDLAALDDDVIEGFMNAFDENPRLGASLVDMLPARLARRSPSESVADVCRKLLGAANRRDLERSLSRSALPAPEVCRFGTAWKRYFCDWRTSIVEAWSDFLLLGSGIRASHVEATIPHPAATFADTCSRREPEARAARKTDLSAAAPSYRGRHAGNARHHCRRWRTGECKQRHPVANFTVSRMVIGDECHRRRAGNAGIPAAMCFRAPNVAGTFKHRFPDGRQECRPSGIAQTCLVESHPASQTDHTNLSRQSVGTHRHS